MDFNPLDIFGDGQPFLRRGTPSQRPYKNFPQTRENDSWEWAFRVPGHGPANDPTPDADCSRESTSRHRPRPPSQPNRKGRVFSVPVYDGTQSPSVRTKAKAAAMMDRTVAAVKIQSIFRGFCVRSSSPLENLKIIGQVKLDADKLEQTLTEARQTQRIRENGEEYLKLDHQILSLLLRLDAIQVFVLTALLFLRASILVRLLGDVRPCLTVVYQCGPNNLCFSVQGVKSFVRESKRAVNRHVFKLQEALDAIVSGKSMEGVVQIDYEHTHEIDSPSTQKRGAHAFLETEPEEITRKAMGQDKCTVGACDCEGDTREKLKDLEIYCPETVRVHEEQHRDGGKIECDAAWEAVEGGGGGGGVGETENETLKKMVADLWRKAESGDKLINDLTIRVAHLEQQLSEEKREE